MIELRSVILCADLLIWAETGYTMRGEMQADTALFAISSFPTCYVAKYASLRSKVDFEFL